jgi:hypothetical protein
MIGPWAPARGSPQLEGLRQRREIFSSVSWDLHKIDFTYRLEKQKSVQVQYVSIS